MNHSNAIKALELRVEALTLLQQAEALDHLKPYACHARAPQRLIDLPPLGIPCPDHGAGLRRYGCAVRSGTR